MTMKKDKKAEIIQQATPIFVEHGYKNSTMRLIASELDINLATVSYYFKSKENLYLACIQRSMSILLDFMTEVLLEPALTVESKNQAKEILINSILQFSLKNLSDEDFKNHSNLINYSLVQYKAAVPLLKKEYLNPVYFTFIQLLAKISTGKKTERQLFLQVSSLIGSATVFIRDYPFIFEEGTTISDEDYEYLETLIDSHLRTLINAIAISV